MLLYRILVSLDRFYIGEKNRSKILEQQRRAVPKMRDGTNGTGYGRTPFGFYSQFHFHSYAVMTAQLTADQISNRDFQLQTFFRCLSFILKTSSNEPGLLEVMRLSLMDVAFEEMLRNDSISDCSDRPMLYFSFLYCLDSLASNPVLTAFYTEERDEVVSTEGLEEIMSGRGTKVRKQISQGSDADNAKLPSLLELMDKLGRQAETFVKNSAGLNTAETYFADSISLSQGIIHIRKVLHDEAQKVGGNKSASATSSPKSREEIYKRDCLQLCYDEFPPTAANTPFSYFAEASSLYSLPVNPRRTITLAKELCTMATSLPPGIFVRSAPNRPDCIKALVAGAEGTPYYGGLFEFDIFAPANYPATPPRVNFLTTGQNRVRFNPNLYAFVPVPY
jgi:Ubiquitin-conjugating enzyme